LRKLFSLKDYLKILNWFWNNIYFHIEVVKS
jgi:hypothetical protein